MQCRSKNILVVHCFPYAGQVCSKIVASVLSPLMTARTYQVQDYHLSVRDNTRSSQRDPSAKDNPTLQLVKKKKTRNAEKVVEVRYKSVDHRPAPLETAIVY
jgi:hypothetical protein